MKAEYEIADRFGPGIDHGAAGKIILRYGDVLVVWRGGSAAWSGIGMSPSYSPVSLDIENLRDERGHRWLPREVLSGGRLSQKRWKEARPKIAELLKVPVAKIPAELPKRTEVIE